MKIAAHLNVMSHGWRYEPPAFCTAIQKDWLTRRASLTAMLAKLGAVSVRVVSEKKAYAWFDEACHGVFALDQPVWIREVVLCVDQVACVIAHSLTSLPSSQQIWRAMRQIAQQPLADLLYDDVQVMRTALVSQSLFPCHPLYQLAAQSTAVCAPFLLARRSIFEKDAAPLMVTECFLPALWRCFEN